MAASVASQIDDTRLAVGGQIMQEATQVYNYVKTAAKTTPGLKPIANQLGERWKGQPSKRNPPNPRNRARNGQILITQSDISCP
uniref:Uncharacterized protein n=1 Tax=Candidatus Kentrum sp. FW TaxID=2126338 RepID=A0A450RXD6_9GAMM|nr:MAG: hypothetical protein BECKFW1821A_GA0114235_100549 [Candidatus Kentron sp. FW]